jgi:hypothetical protein
MVMNIQDRVDRIKDSSHLVFLENQSIHEVNNIKVVEESVFVETNNGFLFLDIDVVTLDEACSIEYQIQKLKEEYEI